MWILTQKRDRLINTDNVKQIRVMEDGEIHADGITLGKYKDARGVLMDLVSNPRIEVGVMPEGDSDDA